MNNTSTQPIPHFLELVAADLYQKYGNDLSRIAIVFPNKRASLFFNQYLATQSERPIWAPAFVTISELFQQFSTLQAGDPIRLVCELYKVFKAETQSEETLDEFYFWGELLISDFDDVDKNRVDADKLFTNLQDLHKLMGTYDFLDAEQEEAIRQFFQNFSIERRTQLKDRFISLWDKLGNIYRSYNERLAQLGIAYEGMIHRQAADKLAAATDLKKEELFAYDQYVFVGFNVLNQVEIALFKQMQEAGRALFYWDYDQFYTTLPHLQNPPFTHEAGEFILRNLKLFPNELAPECFDNLRKPKNVRFISAPTENAQARFLPQWLKEELTTDEKETAVVLCNESLLLPVLHSIPEEVKAVNITMGFPLSQTPVFSLLNLLIELQTTGYESKSGRYRCEAVTGVLKHPYVQQLSAQALPLIRTLTEKNRFYPFPSELKLDSFLEQLFTPQDGNLALCRYLCDVLQQVAAIYRDEGKDNEQADVSLFDQLYRESLFKSFTLINRISTLIESGDLEGLRTLTLKRLLNRLLTAANIPFHGEPAIGMQVMGVLETRNLDFKHLLMLSLNEGKLPKAEGDSSFIPYNLRKAFGMTTIEHKNSVYAYYFYRLIQRAESITLLYNTSSDGLNRGEMSRFMLQFLVESPHPIARNFLEAGQSPQPSREITIEKTPEMMEHLRRYYDATLHPKVFFSPSALNCYLDCTLKFYYRHVAHLKVPNEVSAEIDSALFGTIFHYAAELVYKHLTAVNKVINKEDLNTLINNEAMLQLYVDKAFKEEFFHVAEDERPEYNGTQLINSKVILSYLKQLLRNDRQYAPFVMEGMEEPVYEDLTIDTPLGRIPIRIGGTIDRLDSKEGTLRIVDYKTGGSPKIPQDIEQLFMPAFNRPGYIFQTFLYAAIMCRKQPLKVAPSLLYIHRASSDSYSPVIEMGAPRQPKIAVNNFALFEEEFRERLAELFAELFNPDIPFTQTTEERMCEFCDFRSLCKK